MADNPHEDDPGDDLFDVAVVGGGPAGLSAASWLARYRRSVVVIDSGEYRNAQVDQTHGYLGLDPVRPDELRRKAREELGRYPTVAVAPGTVDRVAGRAGAFELTVRGPGGAEAGGGAGERVVRSRRLLLATGVEDAFPEIEGFFEHYGADVFHCASCDGYEAKERDVVVLGWGEQVAAFARSLLTWASSVTIVTEGRHLEADPSEREALVRAGVAVVEDDGVALVGRRGQLRGVRLAGGGTVPCQLVFFSIAHHPRSSLAVALGCELTEEGCVVVDPDGGTTAAGVFAAGDLTPGVQLVANAVAKGAAAGIACARSLVEPAPEP
ncbi:MAG TPA: NAD(P)/FAD-dependent oxidoreductase [Acidimicrobiales bacterium]|nr:NAD(P)/FAD-dependent oxidoreductase [Acidimicrobiales bacterium]